MFESLQQPEQYKICKKCLIFHFEGNIRSFCGIFALFSFLFHFIGFFYLQHIIMSPSLIESPKIGRTVCEALTTWCKLTPGIKRMQKQLATNQGKNNRGFNFLQIFNGKLLHSKVSFSVSLLLLLFMYKKKTILLSPHQGFLYMELIVAHCHTFRIICFLNVNHIRHV